MIHLQSFRYLSSPAMDILCALKASHVFHVMVSQDGAAKQSRLLQHKGVELLPMSTFILLTFLKSLQLCWTQSALHSQHTSFQLKNFALLSKVYRPANYPSDSFSKSCPPIHRRCLSEILLAVFRLAVQQMSDPTTRYSPCPSSSRIQNDTTL